MIFPLFEIQRPKHAPLKQLRSQSHYFLVYPMTNVLRSIFIAVLNSYIIYSIQNVNIKKYRVFSPESNKQFALTYAVFGTVEDANPTDVRDVHIV